MKLRILILAFLVLLAVGTRFFAGYLMDGLVDCTGTDLISFPIRCAVESRVLLVDTLKLTSVALGISSLLLPIFFWTRRSTRQASLSERAADPKK